MTQCVFGYITKALVQWMSKWGLWRTCFVRLTYCIEYVIGQRVLSREALAVTEDCTCVTGLCSLVQWCTTPPCSYLGDILSTLRARIVWPCCPVVSNNNKANFMLNCCNEISFTADLSLELQHPCGFPNLHYVQHGWGKAECSSH